MTFCFIPVTGEAVAYLFEIYQCKIYYKTKAVHTIMLYFSPFFIVPLHKYVHPPLECSVEGLYMSAL